MIRYLLILFSVTGCSLYQSEGRKWLEQNALDPNRVTLNSLTACTASETEWQMLSQTPDASVFVHASDPLRLRVLPHGQDWGCNFQFSSAQEMSEHTEHAIELTLDMVSKPKG